MRLENFKKAIEVVASLNKEHNPDTYYALNRFADYTEEEKEKLIHSGVKREPGQRPHSRPLSRGGQAKAIPSSVDWRTKGAVTSIKTQNVACSTSPYYSALVSMEGAWAIAGHPLVSLSLQQILDCDKLDMGCDGGWMYNAFQTVLNQGGIESERDYPTINGSNPNCLFNPSKITAKFSSYVNVTSDDKHLMEALAMVPVASAVDATGNFIYYQSGVYQGGSQFTNPDLGIGVVGYGATKKGIPFYILKNIWGTEWGMDGYMLIKRGNNNCGICDFASYAVV